MKKVKRGLLFIIISTLCGGLLTYYFFIKIDSPSIASSDNSSINIISEDTIVNKIQCTSKLISLETDLTESITLNQSWGDLSAFKKIQRIDFSGKGNYIIDLNNFTNDNIKIDSTKRSIIVKIPKPSINDIFIDKEKTIYYTVDNGLLRFGDVTMSSTDYSYIEKKVLEKMKQELSSTKIYEKAEFSSKEQIRNIIESIYSDVDVKIEFQD